MVAKRRISGCVANVRGKHRKVTASVEEKSYVLNFPSCAVCFLGKHGVIWLLKWEFTLLFMGECSDWLSTAKQTAALSLSVKIPVTQLVAQHCS